MKAQLTNIARRKMHKCNHYITGKGIKLFHICLLENQYFHNDKLTLRKASECNVKSWSHSLELLEDN